MTTEQPAVETINLTKRFPKQAGWTNLLSKGGERLVLDSVNLAVQHGEIYGLLGPNGAGKTTLMKLLASLVTPTSGVARVAGFDVVRDSSEARRNIGFVFGDERSFFWRLSIRENLRFFGTIYGMDGKALSRRIEELLEMVDLTEAGDLRMHHFSSGMKQRASIARGLLSDPPVILLDEPTKAVDPVGAYGIRKMIQERLLAGGRRAIILATNVMAEAEALCGRMAMLNHGSVELEGTVQYLRSRFQPDDTYLLKVTGNRESIEALRQLPGITGLHFRKNGAGPTEVELTVAHGAYAIPEVIRRLAEASVDVWHCSRHEMSLDEMFRVAFGEGGTLTTEVGEPAVRVEMPS